MTRLAPRQQQIMDLWHAGETAHQIARRTGRPVAKVRSIISECHGLCRQDDARAIQDGSRRLAKALQQQRNPL